MQFTTQLLHATYESTPVQTGSPQRPADRPAEDKPPRRPDWLLIMIGVLLLTALLIAWFAGVPLLGR